MTIENFKKTPHFEGFRKAIEYEIHSISSIRWCEDGEYNKAVVTANYDDFDYDLTVICNFENNYTIEIV